MTRATAEANRRTMPMTQTHLLRALMLGTALTLALAGCKTVYVNPTVSDQAAGLDVRVLPITRENVLLANRAPYAPRSLPEVFSVTAGGGSPRGAGTLPEAPVIPQQNPGTLQLRPPPDAGAVPYRIGVGDVLRLATRGQSDAVQDLTGALPSQGQRNDYTVRDDGAIAIPEIGALRLEGLTLDQAEAAVFQRMIESGIDPTFSLEVTGFNSKRVSVGGNVGNPALVPITLNTLNLGQALTVAGGITARDAQFASIRIYRDGTLYQIPLADFYAQPGLQNTTLAAGDAVYVDTSYDLDRALEYYTQQINLIGLRRADRTQALNELGAEIGLRRAALDEQRSNFMARRELGAEERDYVYLAGEVTRQSRYALPYGQQASLADVLYDSGGFNTSTGNPAQIYVLRPSTNPAEFGAVTAWHLDARNAVNFTLATQFLMRPDDIIFIETQPITVWNRTIQQSIPSLLGSVAAATQ